MLEYFADIQKKIGPFGLLGPNSKMLKGPKLDQ